MHTCACNSMHSAEDFCFSTLSTIPTVFLAVSMCTHYWFSVHASGYMSQCLIC